MNTLIYIGPQFPTGCKKTTQDELDKISKDIEELMKRIRRVYYAFS